MRTVRLCSKIDALKLSMKRRNEVPACLLSPSVTIRCLRLPVGEQQAHGIALAFLEEIPFESHGAQSFSARRASPAWEDCRRW